MREIIFGFGIALAVALLSGARAQQVPQRTGQMAGMPLPDKNTPAIVFASRDVSDIGRSIKFYTEVLGLKQVGGFNYDDGSAQEVFLAFDNKPESVKIALQKKNALGSGPLPATDGLNRVVIQVTDIKTARDRAVAFGGKSSGEVYKVNNVWMGGIIDPDGHRIELLQQE
jgi:lactoylglutathione lyase